MPHGFKIAAALLTTALLPGFGAGQPAARGQGPEGQAVKKDTSPATKAAVTKGKERRFDSSLPLLVYAMNPDRVEPRYLGSTPTRNRQGVYIVADTTWYVAPIGAFGFGGSFGITGGVGIGGGVGALGGGAGLLGGGAGITGMPANPPATGQGILGGQPGNKGAGGANFAGGAGALGGLQGNKGVGGVGFVGGAGLLGGAGGPGGPFDPKTFKSPRIPERDLKVLVAEMKKRSIPGLALERVDFRDTDLAILTEYTGLQTLILRQTGITDEGVKQLRQLPSLRCLVLDGDDLTDAGVAHLKGMDGLRLLELSGKQITDASVGHLKGLSGLNYLRLRWTAVSDAGLKQLAAVERFQSANGLQGLDLVGLNFTDAGLMPLAQLGGLKTLRLYLTKTTDAGLETLQKMSGLTALTVDSCGDGLSFTFAMAAKRGAFVAGGAGAGFSGSSRVVGISGAAGAVSLLTLDGPVVLPTGKVTDAGLAHLKGMTGLKDLEIGSWHVSGAALTALQALTGLQRLRLDSPDIDDAGLKALKKMTNLETLDLRGTQITGAGAAHLRGLTRLRKVYGSIACTDADIAQYRRALPRGTRVSRGDLFDEFGMGQFIGTLPRK
jgi:hypothetical protein